MPVVSQTFDERLARRVLWAEGNEVQAAITFFDHREPVTLEDAVAQLEAYGPITSQAFEHAAKAWDIYWHLRDMPGD